MVWSVFPRPISSARIPLIPWWYRELGASQHHSGQKSCRGEGGDTHHPVQSIDLVGAELAAFDVTGRLLKDKRVIFIAIELILIVVALAASAATAGFAAAIPAQASDTFQQRGETRVLRLFDVDEVLEELGLSQQVPKAPDGVGQTRVMHLLALGIPWRYDDRRNIGLSI